MSEEKRQILIETMEKLKKFEEEVLETKRKLEKEREDYKNVNKEFFVEQAEDFTNEEIEDLEKTIESCLDSIDASNELMGLYKEQLGYIERALNFTLGIRTIDDFADEVGKIMATVDEKLYSMCKSFSNETKIPYPFKIDVINEINKKNQTIFLTMLQVRAPLNETELNFRNKQPEEIIKKVKNSLKDSSGKNIYTFYKKNIDFLIKANTMFENKIERKKNQIKEIRERNIKNRKQEIEDNINELTKKIDENENLLETINVAKELYEEFELTGSQDTLIRLTNELATLVLSQSDKKKITYVPTEKVEEVPKTVDSKEEDKPALTSIVEKKLTSPTYYKEPDTQNIICFLGKDDDNIFKDINDHFDYSNRNDLLGELSWLFDYLYKNRDYTGKTGGNPKYFSSPKVKAYLNRLGFNYLRLGVSEAQYRIHVITRDSELLKNLGYGTGRVTFFGALGVNDDNEKTGAYDRIARRGIQNLLGNKVRLQPNFDYIEHIMRGYIPFELLSNSDKDKKTKGMFNGKIKGTTDDKAIEKFSYFHYDTLDQESQENVKKWLDNYFEKQTNKLFNVINEYKENEEKNRKKKKIG